MKEEPDIHKYDDIIDLPHPVSSSHPRMSIRNRAAQFAPFAALTGYGDEIDETARLTDQKIDLDENSKQLLDAKLQLIQEQLNNQPRITITYFQPDDKKDGGAYLTDTVQVKKIDPYQHTIVTTDTRSISIEDILDMQGELFNMLDSIYE